MMGVYMTAFSQPAGRPSAQATASQGLVHLWRHTYEHLYVPLAYSIYAALAAAAQGGGHLDASIVQSISLSPAPFHLAGVALHALNAALCFSLIRRLTGRQPVAWICAMLCKPSAAVVPLLALALDRGVLQTPWKRALLTTAAWTALVLPAALITNTTQGISGAALSLWWQRPFVAGDARAFYLFKTLVPVGLAGGYGLTPQAVLAHPWGYLTC